MSDVWESLELDPFGERPIRESVRIGDTTVRVGDRVILRPRGGADIFDLALANKTAIVQAIEVNYEDQILLAVLVDDDPGRDLGAMLQPGHRFFFAPEDVEPLPAGADGAAGEAPDAESPDAGGPATTGGSGDPSEGTP